MSDMKIKIADGLELPNDAITQTFAQIGKRGAGKTYLASMIAEQMLDIDGQIIVIDPIGNWWGLRVNADGESKGKDVFVMGGSHGDVPLSPNSGKEIAKILTEKSISVVLDISEFRKNDRKKFVTDFAEEFYYLKKLKPSAVHIFLEEAQKFVPQRVQKDEARMLGAWEDIVRLGRNCGIGCSLISQRPQSVNKEVLSQVECLCVLQVTGLHERKALEGWIQEAGQKRDIVDELPGFTTGEGYVWSPSWLRVFEKVKFNKKTTMDTSKTPELGKATKVAQLSKIDIKKLENYMNEVIDDSKRELKKINDFKTEVARLRDELKNRPTETKINEVIKVDEFALEKSKLRGFREAEIEYEKKNKVLEITYKTKINEVDSFHKKNNVIILNELNKLKQKMNKITQIATGESNTKIEYPINNPEKISLEIEVDKIPIPTPKVTIPIPTPIQVKKQTPSYEPTSAELYYENGEPIKFTLCSRKIYSFLFANQDREFSRIQLATITGYSHKSGGFGDAISKLNILGLIKKNGLMIKIKNINQTVATEETQELSIQSWLLRLNKCTRTILKLLIDNPYESFERFDIAEKTGYSATSGGFGDAISKLNVLGMITKNGTSIQINSEILELL